LREFQRLPAWLRFRSDGCGSFVGSIAYGPFGKSIFILWIFNAPKYFIFLSENDFFEKVFMERAGGYFAPKKVIHSFSKIVKIDLLELR